MNNFVGIMFDFFSPFFFSKIPDTVADTRVVSKWFKSVIRIPEKSLKS